MCTPLSGDVIVGLCAGLDDGEETASDPNSIQGGYLSFLQLRHLRIRDLQRTVRSPTPPAAPALMCTWRARASV